ncbi:MAG: hypothetical protein AAB229_09695, partial [Candidatus Hydrogenedentota bacterium]
TPSCRPGPFLLTVALAACAACGQSTAPAPFQSLVQRDWDRASEWTSDKDGNSAIKLSESTGLEDSSLVVDFTLGNGGWVLMGRNSKDHLADTIPLAFLIRAKAKGNLEMKFIDVDGSVFGRKVPLDGQYADWTQIILYKNGTEYWWGGDDNFDELAKIELAFSGQGGGKVEVDEIGFGPAGARPTFDPVGPLLDPDRELAGIGFRQRRDEALVPEETGVLEYLKQVQDISSPAKNVLPSQECNELQTFNNSLVAMAFMVKGERERAERILDFYAKATNRRNTDPSLQNFFYKGEARGFFQFVNLHDEGGDKAYHNPGNRSDRWMGDMAWMLMACKQHEKMFSSKKYAPLAKLLQSLLTAWYTKAPDGLGGYVQHGWRKGDQKLHEDHGHPEGNIDCYAAFLMCGDRERAAEIRIWLDRSLKGKNLPLDLYTWRVLAFGREAAPLLDIPEFDLRYRKTLTVNGRQVAGFYHGPDPKVENAWLDGTGHIAVAYLLYGDPLRGNFYANQLDGFMIDRELNGVTYRVLPYTANGSGGYDWVKQDRGFISVCAWYIFAKNKFNPMVL